MDKPITINKDKQNSLAFNVAIEGIDTSNIQVKFLIELDNMSLSFLCEHTEDDEYKVIIPPLNYVKSSEYTCKIEVVAAEYFFSAMDGKIKLTESPKVSAAIKQEIIKEETPITPIVSIKTSEIVVEEKEAPKLDEESAIIAVEPVDMKPNKSKAVTGILKELGIKSTINVPKSLHSFINKGR